MTDYDIEGCHILVVEDEYMLADMLADILSNAGAIVIGPVGKVDKAIGLIGEAPVIDAAVLDVNLRGEMVYPAADILMAREIPFIFMTGYDPSAIPQRFREIIKCEKSAHTKDIIDALGRAMGRHSRI